MNEKTNESEELLLTLTSDIVTAHVGNNSVAVAEVPTLIASVYGSLKALGVVSPEVEEALVPAVPVRSSIKPEYIVCLEDGKKMKMLTRHIRTRYDLTPDQYRARWNLPADYPMTAPKYSERRRELAKTIGLGRKPNAKAAEAEKPVEQLAAPKKRATRKSTKSPG